MMELWEWYWYIAWNLMPWLLWTGLIIGSAAGFLYSWGQHDRRFKAVIRTFVGGCMGITFGIYSALFWGPNTVFLWVQLAHRIADRKAREREDIH